MYVVHWNFIVAFLLNVTILHLWTGWVELRGEASQEGPLIYTVLKTGKKLTD